MCILVYIIIVIKYICDNKYMPDRMPKCINNDCIFMLLLLIHQIKFSLIIHKSSTFLHKICFSEL